VAKISFQAILSTFHFFQQEKLKNRHAKFQNPTITPSRRTASEAKRKTEREKNAVNSGHLVPSQRTQASWTKNNTSKVVLHKYIFTAFISKY
jgi:hypothetical protein